MAIPLIVSAIVFNEADATATVVLKDLNLEFQKCVSVVFDVVTTGFSGTLDFQSASPAPVSTQRNVGWSLLDIDTDSDRFLTNDQESFTTSTAQRRYLVPISGLNPQVVMTRTAGTITCVAVGYGDPLAPSFMEVVSKAQAVSITKAEDVAHASGDYGVMMLAVRDDVVGVLSGTEGDYEPLHTDNKGSLRVTGSKGSTEATTKRGTNTSSTTRATLITPTSGKAVRILSVNIVHEGATSNGLEVYFGTGANITTTAGKEITEERAASIGSYAIGWNDGAGPVGAADDVVSIRGTASVAEAVDIIVVYREEP